MLYHFTSIHVSPRVKYKTHDGILTLKCTKCAVGWPKYMKACAPCLAL